MVIDKVNGENIPRYLIYDIIRYENEDVSRLSFFPDRLRCIETNLIGMRLHYLCPHVHLFNFILILFY